MFIGRAPAQTDLINNFAGLLLGETLTNVDRLVNDGLGIFFGNFFDVNATLLGCNQYRALKHKNTN